MKRLDHPGGSAPFGGSSSVGTSFCWRGAFIYRILVGIFLGVVIAME